MEPIDRSLGIFYCWWRGDAIPALTLIPDLVITEQVELLGASRPIDPSVLDPSTIARRKSEGNRLYVAHHRDEPVAWGWNATTNISIGELEIDRPLLDGNRYLWGFVTRPAWRGRGIYSHLLQEILRLDSAANRFWIGHEDGNDASARGILKAGFLPVGEVFQAPDGGRRLIGRGQEDRSLACKAVFGVPMTTVTE